MIVFLYSTMEILIKCIVSKSSKICTKIHNKLDDIYNSINTIFLIFLIFRKNYFSRFLLNYNLYIVLRKNVFLACHRFLHGTSNISRTMSRSSLYTLTDYHLQNATCQSDISIDTATEHGIIGLRSVPIVLILPNEVLF